MIWNADKWGTFLGGELKEPVAILDFGWSNSEDFLGDRPHVPSNRTLSTKYHIDFLVHTHIHLLSVAVRVVSVLFILWTPQFCWKINGYIPV